MALDELRQLQALGVHAFEQPLAANDISGLKRLLQRSPTPIALDESVRTPSDLAQFAQLGIVEVTIAKAARSGRQFIESSFVGSRTIRVDGGTAYVSNTP